MEPGTQTLWGRMIGAAALNPNSYKAVSQDEHSNRSAVLIVLIATLATGLGALGTTGVSGFLWSSSAYIASWFVYVGIAYLIAMMILKEWSSNKRFGALLRPLGFAQVPAFLLIVSASPAFSGLLLILVFLWILANSVVAIRQTYSLKTMPAVGVAVAAWLIIVPLGYLAILIR